MHMISLINQIKTNLTSFAKEESEIGRLFSPGTGEMLIFSPEVYNLMQFIDGLFEKNKLAHRFNYQISPVPMPDKMLKISSVNPFRKEHYYLPFLHHLAIQDDRVSAEDLNQYIQSFLTENAHRFSIHDIVIMKSGTTRAVANIRFAVEFLRKQYLIENRTSQHRRSLQPTMLGILTLILMRIKSLAGKLADMITLNNEVVFFNTSYYYFYYPWMLCKSPEELIASLETLKMYSPDIESIQKIKALIKEYYSFISDQVILDQYTGKVNIKPDFPRKFALFINSEAYNWNHADAIIMLRYVYRSLWDPKNEII